MDDQEADESISTDAPSSELLDDCEEQFAQLERLQDEIILCETDLSEGPQEQMLKLCSELEMIAACCEAKRSNLMETHERVLMDTKNKIQKMKDYQDKLMETLGDVLEKHFPPPGQANASKRMKTPHDPYVTLDERFWPPYVEMLLRYSIAARHPENNKKIRLETF
ncbi:hypothetical protein CRUP_003032 [Coryphaenoides rupestris]|nr:hypothetical protein CRUP_003032 [Coryphaenoides rupestris]